SLDHHLERRLTTEVGVARVSAKTTAWETPSGGRHMSVNHNQEVTVASKDGLDVREYSVEQAMSTLFAVRVTAVSANPDIDFEEIIGKDASFTLHGRGAEGGKRTWRGICTEFHQVRVDERGLATYELHLAPRLWLASQRRNHRIFQIKTE